MIETRLIATGKIQISQITGNRRVPERTLEAVKREFGEIGGGLR